MKTSYGWKPSQIFILRSAAALQRSSAPSSFATTIFTPLELLSITKLGKPENQTLKFSKQISGLLKFLSQIIDNKQDSMNFVA
jgi:hypothetical protein